MKVKKAFPTQINAITEGEIKYLINKWSNKENPSILMANSRTENLENKYDPIEANTSDFVLSFYSGLPSLAFLYFWLLLHSNCFGELFLVLLFGQLRKNKSGEVREPDQPRHMRNYFISKVQQGVCISTYCYC